MDEFPRPLVPPKATIAPADVQLRRIVELTFNGYDNDQISTCYYDVKAHHLFIFRIPPEREADATIERVKKITGLNHIIKMYSIPAGTITRYRPEYADLPDEDEDEETSDEETERVNEYKTEIEEEFNNWDGLSLVSGAEESLKDVFDGDYDDLETLHDSLDQAIKDFDSQTGRLYTACLVTVERLKNILARLDDVDKTFKAGTASVDPRQLIEDDVRERLIKHAEENVENYRRYWDSQARELI